jgi:hypothetical protein
MEILAGQQLNKMMEELLLCPYHARQSFSTEEYDGPSLAKTSYSTSTMIEKGMKMIVLCYMINPTMKSDVGCLSDKGCSFISVVPIITIDQAKRID